MPSITIEIRRPSTIRIFEVVQGQRKNTLGIEINLTRVEPGQVIRHLLKRPVGRPPKEPVVWYHDFKYRAKTWDQSRRVVAKVEWHQGELFPRVGFVVINMSLPAVGVTHFYNGRGTAEQWIKEGKYALNWTRLPCHRFVANQVRLWLFVLAYNLGCQGRWESVPVGRSKTVPPNATR